jgi:hypothetical protein
MPAGMVFSPKSLMILRTSIGDSFLSETVREGMCDRHSNHTATDTLRYGTSADKQRFALLGRECAIAILLIIYLQVRHICGQLQASVSSDRKKTHDHCSDHTSRYDTVADKHRFPLMGRECAIHLEKNEREKALDALIGQEGIYGRMLKDIPDQVCKSLQCHGQGNQVWNQVWNRSSGEPGFKDLGFCLFGEPGFCLFCKVFKIMAYCKPVKFLI